MSRTPLGLKGTVVGEGDTCDEALADCESAVRFHVETFGPEVSLMPPSCSGKNYIPISLTDPFTSKIQ